MNTTTGQVRRLEDPDFDWVRGTVADLEFSGDSRYLLTSYETPDHPDVSRSHGHQFVAWDVADGSRTVIEEPGHYWLPSLGSAPTGVVWARGGEVFRADPVTGDRNTVTVPQHVVTASWGPGGTSFAYIGRPSVGSRAPWRLYAGRTVAQARGRELDLPSGVEAGELLGWQDSTHVVVGHHRRTVHVVDIVSGDVEEVDMAGSRGSGERAVPGRCPVAAAVRHSGGSGRNFGSAASLAVGWSRGARGGHGSPAGTTPTFPASRVTGRGRTLRHS